MTPDLSPADEAIIDYDLAALEDIRAQFAQNRQNVLSSQDKNGHFLDDNYPCQVVLFAEDDLPEMAYSCVTSAYLASKSHDLAYREALQEKSGKQAIAYAKKNPIPSPRMDNNHRARMLKVEEHLLKQKFGPENPAILRKLVETKDLFLVIAVSEESYDDSYLHYQKKREYGQNHAGRIAMGIRDKAKL